MAPILYCTPQWLEESVKLYQSNSNLQEKLKKLSGRMCYRIQAEPAWGIDKDIIFGMFMKAGQLNRLSFFSEADAFDQADYIISATPQVWKSILRKERKFLTDFMLGSIKLEHGSKVGVLGLAPHANNVIDVLTQVDLRFPDELTTEELEEYRSQMEAFRADMDV